MPTYTETDFEDHIEGHLNQSGYRSLQSATIGTGIPSHPKILLSRSSQNEADKKAEPTST